MPKEKVINVQPTELDALAAEVQHTFNHAVTHRALSGVTPSLRIGHVREIMDDPEGFTEIVPGSNPQNCATCTCDNAGTCDICQSKTDHDCLIQDTIDLCKNISPFSGMAYLLTTVKKYEYISLVENAYAQIGDKPFQLKATKEMELSKEETNKAAISFYDFLQSFLTENKVRVNEIPEAFDMSTLGEVTEALSLDARKDAEDRVVFSLSENENVMERIFKRSNFMNEYMEVMKDTTDYPIGILWLDDKVIKKERIIKQGKMVYNHQIQCDATRIDPCYFWATEDFKLNTVGRAVFRLVQYTSGDIQRWIEKGITGSKLINKGVKQFLKLNEDGYRMHSAMLFDDHKIINKGNYDVMITRGKYKAENIKQLGVKIPTEFEHEQYIPCEVYFSGSNILQCRVLQMLDEHLGVHTTVFRRRGQSIFGLALHDFIYPFARMYEGAIDAIDLSVKKATGSIIQIDTGVLVNADDYLKKDEKTGEVTLDLSGDLIVEFDSTEAFNSPNFKGTPIHIDQLPNDLTKLIPAINFIFEQLELLTGIPNILTNSSDIPSALRTTGNFNASFAASSKGVKSLFREGEKRVLEPSIRFFFDSKASSGEFGEFLNELEPEILLSDTLTREFNEDNELVIGLQSLLEIGGQLIPPEKVASLVNTLGREVYHLNEDLVPNAGVLSTNQPAAQTSAV